MTVSRIVRALLLLLLAAIIALFAAEAGFRTLHADAAHPLSLSGIRWSQRHITLNAHGFRDHEWSPDDLTGKTVVAVLGDEIALGWGIDDPAQRFSDVLAAALGSDYAVVNLGLLGSGTAEQTDALRALPIAPDVIVWAYALGDIESAAFRHGAAWTVPMVDVPPLARGSHLAAAWFWHDQAGSFPAAHPAYWAWVYGQYDDPLVMDAHAAEVAAFMDAAESHSAPVIAAVFPNPLDVVGSIAYSDRVAKVIAGEGGAVWTLFDAAAGQPDGYTISPALPLPNAAFHRLVGVGLAERIIALPR